MSGRRSVRVSPSVGCRLSVSPAPSYPRLRGVNRSAAARAPKRVRVLASSEFRVPSSDLYSTLAPHHSARARGTGRTQIDSVLIKVLL